MRRWDLSTGSRPVYHGSPPRSPGDVEQAGTRFTLCDRRQISFFRSQFTSDYSAACIARMGTPASMYRLIIDRLLFRSKDTPLVELPQPECLSKMSLPPSHTCPIGEVACELSSPELESGFPKSRQTIYHPFSQTFVVSTSRCSSSGFGATSLRDTVCCPVAKRGHLWHGL